MSPLGESVETAAESRHRYRVLAVQTRLALFLAFVMFIILLVQQYKFHQFNDKVNDVSHSVTQVNDAAHNAQVASEKASVDLANIISQVNSPQAQEQARVTRQRVINMEEKICGGPCPESERKP